MTFFFFIQLSHPQCKIIDVKCEISQKISHTWKTIQVITLTKSNYLRKIQKITKSRPS